MSCCLEECGSSNMKENMHIITVLFGGFVNPSTVLIISSQTRLFDVADLFQWIGFFASTSISGFVCIIRRKLGH